jgi:hypothetical protein
VSSRRFRWAESLSLMFAQILSAATLQCARLWRATTEENGHGHSEGAINDVDSAIGFYTRNLGFHVGSHSGPGLALLSRGDLQLLLTSTTDLSAVLVTYLSWRLRFPSPCRAA